MEMRAPSVVQTMLSSNTASKDIDGYENNTILLVADHDVEEIIRSDSSAVKTIQSLAIHGTTITQVLQTCLRPFDFSRHPEGDGVDQRGNKILMDMVAIQSPNTKLSRQNRDT